MISLNNHIEHTNLKPTFSDRDVYDLIEEAEKYSLKGICLPPFWVKKAAREIASKPILLITVAGFPFGYQKTETKIEEVKQALADGASEIDVVMNISAFKSGMNWVKIELAKLAGLVHESEKLLKVIIETAYLDTDEIVKASRICAEAGADYIKTSTGSAHAGATTDHITLIRQSIPDSVGIKASGGIKTAAQALELIKAGADRIGTSSSISIMQQLSGDEIF